MMEREEVEEQNEMETERGRREWLKRKQVERENEKAERIMGNGKRERKREREQVADDIPNPP